MCGTKLVEIELWPVAADDTGLWLVSGLDAWRSGNVAQDSSEHFEAETLLTGGEALEHTVALHSTSWRPEGPRTVLTYVAALTVAGSALDVWPDAKPIGLTLARLVGPAPTNAATAPPLPRHSDVLLHALRHLAFLRIYDATAAAALDRRWRSHLVELHPALAGMYERPHAEPGRIA